MPGLSTRDNRGGIRDSYTIDRGTVAVIFFVLLSFFRRRDHSIVATTGERSLCRCPPTFYAFALPLRLIFNKTRLPRTEITKPRPIPKPEAPFRRSRFTFPSALRIIRPHSTFHFSTSFSHSPPLLVSVNSRAIHRSRTYA